MPLLSYGKRMPVYETNGARVTLRIFDGTFDTRMALLAAKWRGEGRDVSLDVLLLLTYFREHSLIDTATAAEILQLSREAARDVLEHLSLPHGRFLDRRGRTKSVTYHLNKEVASDLHSKVLYTKTNGLNPIRYKEMVRAFLQDHGSITPRECRDLLGLGESPSARVEISRYLRKWSDEAGFLRREGNASRVRYVFKEAIDDGSGPEMKQVY